jgi:aminobenzoyl-glutamate utilization protein B
MNFTSDDYVEYTWHAPTARFYIGRPMLNTPEAGYQYPAWVMNALGGHRECIDPMIYCASRTIAATLVDLLTKPQELQKAQADCLFSVSSGNRERKNPNNPVNPV